MATVVDPGSFGLRLLHGLLLQKKAGTGFLNALDGRIPRKYLAGGDIRIDIETPAQTFFAVMSCSARGIDKGAVWQGTPPPSFFLHGLAARYPGGLAPALALRQTAFGASMERAAGLFTHPLPLDEQTSLPLSFLPPFKLFSLACETVRQEWMVDGMVLLVDMASFGFSSHRHIKQALETLHGIFASLDMKIIVSLPVMI